MWLRILQGRASSGLSGYRGQFTDGRESDVARSQGMPLSARSHFVRGKGQSPTSGPRASVDFRTAASRGENKFLLWEAIKFVVIYSNSLRKLQQHTFGLMSCLGP